MYAVARQDKTRASTARGPHRLVSSGGEGAVTVGSVSSLSWGTSQTIHIYRGYCKPFARKKEEENAKKMKIVKNATKAKRELV